MSPILDDDRPDILREKELLRSHMKNLSLPQKEISDRQLCKRLLAHPVWRTARTLFCYVSFKNEPDTYAPLKNALERGVRVAVPRIHQGVMSARAIMSLEELRRGPMGLWQPPEEAPVMAPGQLDLIVVPGLAFDRAGRRLGRGGGYYDRYLAQTNATTLALCQRQRLLDHVPVLPHDQEVQIVLTEEECIMACTKAANSESGESPRF